ncbi:unnamed protein product, partial [Gulo gulo]
PREAFLLLSSPTDLFPSQRVTGGQVAAGPPPSSDPPSQHWRPPLQGWHQELHRVP